MATHEENARKVLDYLATRPEEENTLEGIMNWWTRSDRGKHAIAELEESLNVLLEKGEVEKVAVRTNSVQSKERIKSEAMTTWTWRLLFASIVVCSFMGFL